jgi:hypothetical protein
MSARRYAGWAALCVLAVTGVSCDILNPSFVGQLGGDAGNTGPSPTGSIVLIFNNQTTQRLALNYDLELSRAGEGVVTQTGSSLVTSTGYWTATFDCDTTGIILTGISIVSDTGDDTGGTTDIALAVNEFRRPALQCGSVVFVNMPLIGSPTADLLP